MTRVVNRNFEGYDVYIGRGSKWGNPYSHQSGTKAQFRAGSREEAIRLYEAYIRSQPHLLDSLHELEGKVLGCYCKPYACHGDVLVRLIEERKGAGKSMSLKRLKQERAERQKAGGARKRTPKSYVGKTATNTLPKLSAEAKALIAVADTTEQVQTVLDGELPGGYHAIGKNDLPKLMKLKKDLIDLKIASFDYETNGDPEDDTQDPQDHRIVGVSFSCRIGQAFYMPLSHAGYGANWEAGWFVANFLKPVLEHPDVLVIAHNI